MLLACANAQPAPSSPALSIEDLFRDGARYDRAKVRVHGYLVSRGLVSDYDTFHGSCDPKDSPPVEIPQPIDLGAQSYPWGHRVVVEGVYHNAKFPIDIGGHTPIRIPRGLALGPLTAVRVVSVSPDKCVPVSIID